MLGRRKRNRYKFTEKKQSKRGIAALVVAILIEIVYIVFFRMRHSEEMAICLCTMAVPVYGCLAYLWQISGLPSEASLMRNHS